MALNTLVGLIESQLVLHPIFLCVAGRYAKQQETPFWGRGWSQRVTPLSICNGTLLPTSGFPS